jgi:hypothetical protein
MRGGAIVTPGWYVVTIEGAQVPAYVYRVANGTACCARVTDGDGVPKVQYFSVLTASVGAKYELMRHEAAMDRLLRRHGI